MKKWFSVLLAVMLLLGGCAQVKEPVTFYYLQRQYLYGEENGVIVGEAREASGHREDLRYLLALYRMGPSGEELRSPLPAGTELMVLDQTDTAVHIVISDTSATLTDSKFSLACACLARTCLEITGCEEVTITSGSRSVTMSWDNLLLFDSSTANLSEESK